jgi:hypothetical protein
MTFQEIFEENGLYISDSFYPGYCFEVKDGVLYSLQYEYKDDLHPYRENQLMHKSLLTKSYIRVLNINQLFPNQNKIIGNKPVPPKTQMIREGEDPKRANR